jgi:Tfp pilus assembly protein PilW
MCSQRSSRSNTAGFTYAEFLVAGAVAVVVTASALVAYIAAERATAASSAKIEATAQARRALDWVVRDVREGVSWEIALAGNAPSSSHIKFRKVEDWDMANNTTFLLSANYTEYTYYSGNDTLVRNLLDLSNATLMTNTFYNITRDPFYTYNISSGTVVPLTGGELVNCGKIVVSVTAESRYKTGIFVNTTLESEVRLRNG